MRLILAFAFISILAFCSQINSSSQPVTISPEIPSIPPPPLHSNYSDQEGQTISEEEPISSLQSIKSLLVDKYKSLLPEAGGVAPEENNNRPGISSTLKAYQQQLLDYYRKNKVISGSNGNSRANIDNGENNTINGQKNVIKAGDYNNITGTYNTVNGSYNHIIGHNDFVHGSGNLVISNLNSLPNNPTLPPPISNNNQQFTHLTQYTTSIEPTNITQSQVDHTEFQSANDSDSTFAQQFIKKDNQGTNSRHQEQSRTNSLSFSHSSIISTNASIPETSPAVSNQQSSTAKMSSTHVSSQNSGFIQTIAQGFIALLIVALY